MVYKGRVIDPISLWSNYCDVREAKGEFLPLTFCPNPDHNNTRTPAFQINQEKPLVYCFGCGLKGTYAHAISVIADITEKEAERIILGHSRLPTKDDKFGVKRRESKVEPREIEESLGDYTYLPQVALGYLERRGITAASRTRWQLGFDPVTNRITIPVFDQRDRMRHIIRRAIFPSQIPKYLYSKGSSKTECLYGAVNLDMLAVKQQGLILAEGSLDVIKLHQHGIRNAVGILGSALSEEQKQEIVNLRPKALYLFFDADAAGIHALQTVLPLRSKYPVRIIIYPKGYNYNDPADLTKEQALSAIENAISLNELVKRLKKVGIDPKTIDNILGKDRRKFGTTVQ